MKVEYYKHNIGQKEKQKVLECLDGTFLTTGSYVKEFEGNFAEYLGVKYVIGLTSCTAALHLSLLSLGIGEGDEVITTPMTFIATATAIMHAKATPVFVEVEPATGLIDPSKIERAITSRTKAIIPVHLYGQMCDMKKIRKIADKFNLKIIEDAAHCIEGERDGIRPGHLSNCACFSFYATKSITSGEGGAIASNNKKLSEKALILRQHGMSLEAADRYFGAYKHWDMIEYGWKYNMDNIQAALLLPQICSIDQKWRRREKISKKYEKAFKKLDTINFPEVPPNVKSARHLFTICVMPHRRDELLKEFQKSGIGVAVNYRCVHLMKYFKEKYGYKKESFPIAEKIGDSTITLPLYSKMSDNEVKYVINTVKKII